jgi:hypothetical protein
MEDGLTCIQPARHAHLAASDSAGRTALRPVAGDSGGGRFAGAGLDIAVGVSLQSRRFVGVLEDPVAVHGSPIAVRIDNGPECLAQPFVEWAAAQSRGATCPRAELDGRHNATAQDPSESPPCVAQEAGVVLIGLLRGREDR